MKLLLFAVTLSLAATAAAPVLAKPKEPEGLRLQLTEEQLNTVGSGRQLALTPEQVRHVQAKLGKDVSDVRIVYDEPDGEVAELGYNLALRDRPDSILLLAHFAMNPAEATAKQAANRQMIGPPEKPVKEYASFFIDAQGRIWQFMQPDEFAKYVQSHRDHFGYIDVHTRPPENSSSLAYRDTERFMKNQLKDAGALITP
jgi:hypothetical protein